MRTKNVKYMKNKRKHTRKKNYERLKNLASKLNLSFSNWFAFGNKVIGLDQQNETLLIAEADGDQGPPHLIELGKIKGISLLKGYGSIKAGELSKMVIGQFLKYIRLQFEYINHNAPTILSLYEEGNGDAKNLQRLDLSSKSLHVLLSKIVDSGKKMPISA